jgi:poly-gamma-glutamate synthesis protein (capsule biosynthesis protein)
MADLRLRSRAIPVISLVVACWTGSPTDVHAQAPDPLLATTVDDGFTIAIVGDVIVAHSLSHMMTDPGFAEAIGLIQSADVATGNLEGHIIDARTLDALEPGGFGAEPNAADWLVEAGFDLLARANNHADDFSIQGWAETSRHLDRVGIQYAGVGDTYAAARAARFYTSRRGRVGMVATFATEGANISFAEEGRGEWPGRGGISDLQVDRYFMVPEGSFGAVRELRSLFPNSTGWTSGAVNTDQQVAFLGQQFRRAAAGTHEPYFSFEMDEADLADILEEVRDGKLMSDFITVAIHSHHFRDTKGGYRGYGVPETDDLDTNPSIPDFHVEFAHAVIDAGADAYQGTGVHALRGIEIYRGRPIYYGLGEFVRQMDVIGIAGPGGPSRSDCDGCPFPVKFQSVIAMNRFEDGELAEIRLYPVELGYEEVRLARRGIPKMAGPEIARQILTHLQELSRPLGTEIAIEGNVGIIRP